MNIAISRGMKLLVNPLLLLVCIILMAFGTSDAVSADSLRLELWVLALCLMAVIINGALGLARALARRASLVSIGWAVVFLIFGGATWMLMSEQEPGSVSSQERHTLHERMKNWRAGGDPYALDENGDCVPVLAAGLGREEILNRLLEEDEAAMQRHATLYATAAMRAAEHNREDALRLLISHGVAVNARVEGITLLHAAAVNRARRSVACLLALGADVNAQDADGATPLHEAVLAEDDAIVRMLVQHGADPTLTDAEGRDAASYVRNEEMEAALAGKEAQP